MQRSNIEVSVGLNYKVIVFQVGCDVSISALSGARPVNQGRLTGVGPASSVNTQGGPSRSLLVQAASHDNIITPLTFTLHLTTNTTPTLTTGNMMQ